MTPIDKASKGKKRANEEEVDLQREWAEEDIEDANRKPDLSELDDDPSVAGE
jgi:hypothetical protein